MHRFATAIMPLLVITACSTNPLQASAETIEDKTPKLSGAPIENVFARIKQEVGLFYSDGAKSEQNWPQLLHDLNVTPVCGNGHIAFEITSIKMEFAVSNDQTTAGGGGLKIPFGPAPAAANIGPGVSASQETLGTNELVYTYKPLANGPVSTDYDIIREKAVILPTLDHLRDALIKATGYKPCFQSLSAKDPDQTLTFSVAVTQDTAETLGFNFAILNLSASKEGKSTGKNTITVSYRPIPFAGGEQRLMSLHTKLNLK